ncbi:MAG TPA: glucose 1-dehydrogenase [Sphingobium sp.]|uniref:SDR family NAD(P)-dependent oxidoreductase n=1 Tax=Sphingobium sp. TaxID=1912891 RepID=UPI002ED54EE0
MASDSVGSSFASNSRLDGQVAIVTGGGGGIGRAIAISLAQAGADIVIAELIPERCAEAEARITELGRACLAVETDMSKPDQVRDMVEKAKARFGRIDILVNNAGGTSRKDFLTQSENSWRRLIDLNLVSMLAATSAAVPVMIEGGRGGSIINVSSIEGSRAAPGFAVYSACKAGMNNFTRTMALELADHDIRVNVIAPDFTVTPGTRGNISGPVDEGKWLQPTPQHEEATARRIPLRRPGIDAECGQAAVYLASSMSSYVTGITLPVDGGSWASSGWVRDRTSGKWVLVEVPA